MTLRGSRIEKWSLIGAAVFAVLTFDIETPKWTILQFAVFAVPLFALRNSSENQTIWVIWGSIFYVIQSLLLPLLIDDDFKTLHPNLNLTLNVKGGIPGISGDQHISTDYRGFRTTKNIDYSASNSFRIFAIGGSTTEEIHIDDRDTWPNLLQQSLDHKKSINVEVINTGLSGLRANNHVATLRKDRGPTSQGRNLSPGINDWNHHITSHFSTPPSYPERLLELISRFRDKFKLKNTPLGNAIAWIYGALKATVKGNAGDRGKIIDDFGEYYTNQRGSLDRNTKYSFKPENVAADYARSLGEISEMCKQNNIKCGFITQPTGYQASASEAYKNGFWMTPPNKDYTLDFESMVYLASLYNGYLKQFANEHGHYLRDAADKLTPTYDNFFDDAHFNTAAGAKDGANRKRMLSEHSQ